jgi:UDP-4-amino-4,6-dideoxy-N-acetyl-beta-L-altrosamine N-acetyltransferase
MMLVENCTVRNMIEDDVEQVLAWRNNESVRRYMYTQHHITLDEHRKWFESSRHDPNRWLLIFEVAGKPLGFINIKRVADGNIVDWGFYAAPDAPKGTGTRLGMTVLDYAFNTLNLYKVCGQAITYNTPSVNFHKKLGFSQEGVLRDQHFDGQYYHDVVHFGLLAHEWKNKGKEQ